jgi:hypothetical protein
LRLGDLIQLIKTTKAHFDAPFCLP